ncbi:MAG: glycolate oxidase subunit GlcE [Gammaproteobacteria bacterium]
MLRGDLTTELQSEVVRAIADARPLRIVGGNTKDFYGGHCLADRRLDTSRHSGVVDYEPTELVITVHAGTPLSAISKILSAERQMLGFEPPEYAGRATLGGTLACGFSGPRRPFAGSARDAMLGCKVINGYGQVLNFGGKVMKNVAGFDVSRLMVGALGTLGVIVEASVRVISMPETESTLTYAETEQQAIEKMNRLLTQAWPVSAMAYDGERVWLRLSGACSAVKAAAARLGGDFESCGERFWLELREQQLPFFSLPGNLWRISVAPATRTLPLSGQSLIDWGGALRWLKTDAPSDEVHRVLAKVGGYAVCFCGDNKKDWFRLEANLSAMQQQLRAAFDPLSLFNPGRLWP